MNISKLPKLVKLKLATMAQKQYSTKDIFSSSEFLAMLQTWLDTLANSLVAKASGQLSREYKRFTVRTVTSSGLELGGRDFIAVTKNNEIIINTGHNRLKPYKSNKKSMFAMVCGLFAHELAHVLYSSFIVLSKARGALENNGWFPRIPTVVGLNGIPIDTNLDKVFSTPFHKIVFMDLARTINNILEDGYIENRFAKELPGELSYYLRIVNNNLFVKKIKSYEQMKNEETDPYHIAYSLFFDYAKTGKMVIKRKSSLQDQPVAFILHLLPLIDRFMIENSPEERYALSSEVTLLFWDTYFKGNTDTMMKALLKALQEFLSSSEADSNASTVSDSVEIPIPANAQQTSADKNRASVREKLSKALSQSSSSMTPGKPSESTDSESAAEQPGNDESPTPPEEDLTSQSTSSTNSSAANEGKPGLTQEGGGKKSDSESSSETGNTSETDTASSQSESEQDAVSDDQVLSDEDFDQDSETNDSDDRLDKRLQSLLDDLRLRDAVKECERNLEEDLRKNIDAFKSSLVGKAAIHKNVKFNISRCELSNEETAKAAYDVVMSTYGPLSRQMRRQVEVKLKDYRQGGKRTGLYTGKSIYTPALLSRDDNDRIFYRNKQPAEIAEMCIGILVDMSGSMNGARINAAIASASLLYDFCTSLSLPVTVYGHNTTNSFFLSGDEKQNLISYADFGSVDGKDKYRIMTMACRGCNRDGAAIAYMMDLLKKRPEEHKFLFIISDGQPNANNYSGEVAFADIREQVIMGTRKNITTVAAAIGEDLEQLMSIYPICLDMRNLSELPKKFTSILVNAIKKRI